MFAQLAFFLSVSSSLLTSFNSSTGIVVLPSFLCAHTTFFLSVCQVAPPQKPFHRCLPRALVFACLLISTSALFSWTTIAAVGIDNADYYLTAFCCFSLPCVSSFKAKHEARYHDNEAPTTASSSAFLRVASTLSTFSFSLSSSTSVIVVSAAEAVVVGFPIMVNA
ncbi:hypothetical protein Fmac_015021 [Flemingia macrophylla]|uniref:Uncharacterized protein n=1 Tax=Flemingia macrophylla TaxID=520843 RepID=A0ABD1MDE0_9FABA